VTAVPKSAGGGEELVQRVTVLFFASAREAAGTGRTEVPAAGRTVEDLLDDLCSEFGDGLRTLLPSCAVWVNRSPTPRNTVLSGGDEVAVLPPVSGGCGSLDLQWL
jgi:MoaD family protein